MDRRPSMLSGTAAPADIMSRNLFTVLLSMDGRSEFLLSFKIGRDNLLGGIGLALGAATGQGERVRVE